ncbi:hypothetical protein [Arcobacter cloacae]|uniref:Uncharacterized protein n=1 Tax=Arcobacter cloacae TaxID=1054034 RepID=A0A4Q0ZJ15_9BACT|nr:hypothetical protein [Arcobacter cloacae]RXJ85091.1 hypothetical protein CRU90_03805 [Arcobacter cloacae]
MLGNIWLSSALIVTAIFSAGAMYKSYSDIQEAKQVQEHYEIIFEIKTLLAKQYNKNPQDITRDEIIAHLPKGGNWEKVLLLDRQKDSNLSNKALVNQDGNIEISQDEKLKLLALKAKLRDMIDLNNIEAQDGKYTFEISMDNKNIIIKDEEIEKSVKRAISYMITKVIHDGITDYSTFLDEIKNFTPYESIYHNLGEDLSEELLKEEKEKFFKAKIKNQLLKNQSGDEARLYFLMKDIL